MDFQQKVKLCSPISSLSVLRFQFTKRATKIRLSLLRLILDENRTHRFQSIRQPQTCQFVEKINKSIQRAPAAQIQETYSQNFKRTQKGRESGTRLPEFKRAESHDGITQRKTHNGSDFHDLGRIKFRPENKRLVGHQKLQRMNLFSRSKSHDCLFQKFRANSLQNSAYLFTPQEKRKENQQNLDKDERCKRGLKYLFSYVDSFMILKPRKGSVDQVKILQIQPPSSQPISETSSEDEISPSHEESQDTQVSPSYLRHISTLLQDEIEEASKDFPICKVNMWDFEGEKRNGLKMKYFSTTWLDYGKDDGQQEVKTQNQASEFEQLALKRAASASYEHFEWRKWYT